MKKWLTGLGNR